MSDRLHSTTAHIAALYEVYSCFWEAGACANGPRLTGLRGRAAVMRRRLREHRVAMRARARRIRWRRFVVSGVDYGPEGDFIGFVTGRVRERVKGKPEFEIIDVKTVKGG